MTRREWQKTHQGFEAAWWGDCANTYGEETKQLAYAKVMGLDPGPWQAGNPWPVYDMGGRSVADIGGGPVSMLLKCVNVGTARVVDPCKYPEWTDARYAARGIYPIHLLAEDWLPDALEFDEAWCYNVLQHVHQPRVIAEGMRRIARTVRVFEWVETAPYTGHPHTLHVSDLQEWFGGEGRTVLLDEQYQETEARTPEMEWRVEQLAWGGVFE